ncbi:MAG: hypothetical protein FWF90_12445 [Promicromonosporaceae bacterium]|nr:hypothetical protein [Promicromonosporaceae bacterium]
MSNLLTREVLDPAVIDRDVSQTIYAYDAAVREDLTDDDSYTPCPGVLEFHGYLTEFVD